MELKDEESFYLRSSTFYLTLCRSLSIAEPLMPPLLWKEEYERRSWYHRVESTFISFINLHSTLFKISYWCRVPASESLPFLFLLLDLCSPNLHTAVPSSHPRQCHLLGEISAAPSYLFNVVSTSISLHHIILFCFLYTAFTICNFICSLVYCPSPH